MKFYLLNKVGDTLSASANLFAGVIELLKSSASRNDLIKLRRIFSFRNQIRLVVSLTRNNFVLH